MFSLGLVLNSLKILLRFLLRLALSFVHVGFRIRVWLRYIFFLHALRIAIFISIQFFLPFVFWFLSAWVKI